MRERVVTAEPSVGKNVTIHTRGMRRRVAFDTWCATGRTGVQDMAVTGVVGEKMRVALQLPNIPQRIKPLKLVAKKKRSPMEHI